MRTSRYVCALILAVTMAACADRIVEPIVTDILAAEHGGNDDNGGKRLTVMSRNLYLGADLNPVIASPIPQLIPIRVATVWAAVQATNFPERAKSLADEIVEAQPELIGLQEVSIWRTQFPGDAHLPTATPATEVVYDFLAILLAELAARGQKYVVVSSVQNLDAELFMFTGTPGASLTRDLRLTDRDVILAKHNLKTFNAQSANYNAKIALPIGGAGGPTVVIPRGWNSVDVKFHGETFRFFNTHLEVGSPPFGSIQVAQGNEVVALLNASPLPVVAVGDYNSPADGSGTSTYLTLSANGFSDVWSDINPFDLGYTGGLSNDLLGPVTMLNSRIDLALFKGTGIASAAAWLVGNKETDRTPSGLMPSDHAGLVATVLLGVKH